MKPIFGFFIKAAMILFLPVCLLLFVPIRSNAINHFILSSFEKKIPMTVEFKNSKIWLPGNILLKDVTASEKGSILCRAETLDVDYNLAAILFGKREVIFSIKEVRFYKDIGLMNAVSGMLAVPKMPDIGFSAIEGDFEFQRDAVHIKKLAALSDNVSMEGEGRIKKNGDLDCNMHFSFNRPITDAIPDLVKATLLREEKYGWMGITLKATGNYAKPSLHVDSEMFKLNIGETVIRIK